MAKLKVFENMPTKGACQMQIVNFQNTLQMFGMEIPEGITMNTLAMIMSKPVAGVDISATVSMGFYSLNGSTLSLYNSASYSTSHGVVVSAYEWITLALSAQNELSAGNWWVGVHYSSAGANSYNFLQSQVLVVNSSHRYAGPFVRGAMSVTTSALPTSLETSALSKEAGPGNSSRNMPYILISS